MKDFYSDLLALVKDTENNAGVETNWHICINLVEYVWVAGDEKIKVR